MGCEVVVAVTYGLLDIGAWQRIFLWGARWESPEAGIGQDYRRMSDQHIGNRASVSRIIGRGICTLWVL